MLIVREVIVAILADSGGRVIVRPLDTYCCGWEQPVKVGLGAAGGVGGGQGVGGVGGWGPGSGRRNRDLCRRQARPGKTPHPTPRLDLFNNQTGICLNLDICFRAQSLTSSFHTLDTRSSSSPEKDPKSDSRVDPC